MTVRVYQESAEWRTPRLADQAVRMPQSRSHPVRHISGRRSCAPFDGDSAAGSYRTGIAAADTARRTRSRTNGRETRGRAGVISQTSFAVPDRSGGVECRCALMRLRISHADMSERRHQHAHAEVEPSRMKKPRAALRRRPFLRYTGCSFPGSVGLSKQTTMVLPRRRGNTYASSSRVVFQGPSTM